MTVTRPWLGMSRPLNILARVDLPEPLWPMMATKSPPFNGKVYIGEGCDRSFFGLVRIADVFYCITRILPLPKKDRTSSQRLQQVPRLISDLSWAVIIPIPGLPGAPPSPRRGAAL